MALINQTDPGTPKLAKRCSERETTDVGAFITPVQMKQRCEPDRDEVRDDEAEVSGELMNAAPRGMRVTPLASNSITGFYLVQSFRY
jgi:hypothetical protein